LTEYESVTNLIQVYVTGKDIIKYL